MMHPALLKLMWLLMRARFRRLTRGMGTLKGVLCSLVVLGMFAPAIVAVLFGSRFSPIDPSMTRSFVSVGLLGVCVLQVLTVKPEAGIPFLPAEVDMLFPGPFSRRDLLLYKLFGAGVTVLGFGLLMSCYFRGMVNFWIAGFVGIVLSGCCVSLVGFAVTLFVGTVAERAFTRGRKLLLAGVVICGAIAIGSALAAGSNVDPITGFQQFTESWLGRCLLAPFDVFARTVTAQSIFPELIGWGTLAASMNAGLVLLILRLDANFLEASTLASQKLYERIQNARRGAMWTAASKSVSRSLIPMLPRLGGVGPILWRQLNTATRGSRTMLFMLFIIAGSFIVPMSLIGNASDGNGVLNLNMLAVMSLVFFPQLVRLDFRGDVDRMETLKTLPIRPSAIVIGQILTPVLLLLCLQLAILGALTVIQRRWPEHGAILLAFALPVNWTVFCLENLLFLLYPYRMPAGGGVDFQSAGRQTIVVLFKFIVLALLAGVAAGLGGAVYFLTESWTAFVATAWMTTCALAAAGVLPVAWAYRRFDPSMDTPP